MKHNEFEAAALANCIEEALNNPEETAQRVQKKIDCPMEIFGIIQDFITSYEAKESGVSDEQWLVRQFSKPEYADAFKDENAGEESCAAAKAIVQGVEDYETAKKSLCFHIDHKNGSPETWLAEQIEIGAENNSMNPAEYAALLSEGLDEAIEENAHFVFDDKETYTPSVPGPADKTSKPGEILDKLWLNSDLTIALPPVQAGQQAEAEFFESEPVEAEQKAFWYERVADRLKRWTYPIAGGLEIARRLGLLPPPLMLINYNTLGARVRNGIDNIVTAIQVATGKIPVLEGIKEYQRNRTAHLGDIAAAAYTRLKERLNLSEHPVKAAAKLAFGKAGSAVGYIAQQAAAAIVPPAVRTAIKTGVQAVGRAAANGIKAAGNVFASAGRSIANFFSGRR